MTRSLIPLACAVLFSLATPAEAQFSFMERRKPDEAMRVAKSNQVGILHLLLKDDYGDLPGALYDQEFAKMTKEIPLVIEDGTENGWITFGGDSPEAKKRQEKRRQELRAKRIAMFAKFDMTVKQSAFVITDWHGNMLHKVEIGRDYWDDFKPESLERLARGAAKFVLKARKGAQKDLKKAKRSLKNERWRTARKAVDDILVYEGFEEVAEAKELRKQIVAEGRKQLDAAMKLEDETEKRNSLRNISRNFEETEIGEEAKKALEALKS